MANYWIEKAEKEDMEINLYKYIVKEFDTENFSNIDGFQISDVIETFTSKYKVTYIIYWMKVDGKLSISIP